MNNRERLKLIIENWFIEKTSIKPTDEGLNNLVDRIYYDKQLIIGGVSCSSDGCYECRSHNLRPKEYNCLDCGHDGYCY